LRTIAILYLTYMGGRVLASHHSGEAFHHAEDVWHFERLIGREGCLLRRLGGTEPQNGHGECQPY